MQGMDSDTRPHPMHLPLLPLQTGVVLQGISRRGGRAAADEDASGRRRRTTAPTAAAFGSSGATRLSTVAIELRTPTASATSLARLWQASVRASMLYKRQIYTQERAAMQAEIYDAQAKVAAFVRQARGGGPDALADAQTPTWDVSEKVSSRWQALVMQSASLDRLVQTAQSRHDMVNNSADFGTLRVEFASAIEDLVADYPSQPVLLETIADVVEAFIRQPLRS